jgi:hypothetical protein
VALSYLISKAICRLTIRPVRQRVFVNRSKDSGAERIGDGERAANDLLGEAVQLD